MNSFHHVIACGLVMLCGEVRWVQHALAADRPRVIVSSDIGGSDPDDKQSFAHLLVYADVLQLEGLISSPPHAGRLKDIYEAVDAYETDYPKLMTYTTTYPTPKYLRSVSKQGETTAWDEGGGGASEGSRWIIERAKQADPRPLYVLVFGSITDVAQALKDDPSIKAKLRVYFIASWNQRQDQAAFEYIDKQHSDLWMIYSNTTFRGMYNGGKQEADLGNKTFPEAHVRGHGALGDYFWQAKRDIKMGDTPSVLYLLNGDPNDPTGESWGGSYVPLKGRPNWWIDDPSHNIGNYPGAQSVSRWREAYLRDWQHRMDRCVEPKP